jgi:hypothetical protein
MILNSYVAFARLLMNTENFHLLVWEVLWRSSSRTSRKILMREKHYQFGVSGLLFLLPFLICHGVKERGIVP